MEYTIEALMEELEYTERMLELFPDSEDWKEHRELLICDINEYLMTL